MENVQLNDLSAFLVIHLLLFGKKGQCGPLSLQRELFTFEEERLMLQYFDSFVL